MKKILFVITAALILSSCSKTLLITQGEQGYSGELDEKYDIVELNTVSASGYSTFGFGSGEIHKDGVITNFLGSNLGYSQSNFLRGLTFFVNSAILPILTPPLGIVNIFGGIAVGAVINNLVWNKTSSNEALRKASKKLIEENPSIDLFVYPKYNIQTKNGLFTNKSNITIKSKGAKLKTNDKNNAEMNSTVKDTIGYYEFEKRNMQLDDLWKRGEITKIELKKERKKNRVSNRQWIDKQSYNRVQLDEIETVDWLNKSSRVIKRKTQLDNLLRKGSISQEDYDNAVEGLQKFD